MLDPTDRSVLTETLRPPTGFRIDQVIVTTYSLDLVALLTLPLSFTLLAGDGISETGRVDPVGLLDALRRHAGRIHVFCDAGRISVPKRGQPLFGYLEKTVVEVQAPKGGAFHPKVTIVRYLPDPGNPICPDEDRPDANAVHYRLLCGTRNLTFDRSWDTVLTLDGDLDTARVVAHSRNRPLARFVETLPRLATRPLPESSLETLRTVADELLRVRFTSPESFEGGTDDLVFWPLGLEKTKSWPFTGRTSRLLVVSPFLDERCLSWLREEGTIAAVVSRGEELDALHRDVLEELGDLYILADAAEGAPDGDAPSASSGEVEADTASSSDDSLVVEPSDRGLSGLHAKLFVADAGWDARLWTGSANATEAAFTKNVEFLVELRGKKSKVGIDALLGAADPPDAKDNRVRFRNLLVPYQAPDGPKPTDPVLAELERILQKGRRSLVRAQLLARVVEISGRSAQAYDLHVESGTPEEVAFPDSATCTVRPISLPPEQAAPVQRLSGRVASFQAIAFESLTGFCAFTLTATLQGQKSSIGFVLCVPLVGAPADRENRLLLAMLSNRERLLRYLLMLLQGPDFLLREMQRGDNGGTWRFGAASGAFGLPLLEPMLRTLADDPSRLEPIERLVRDLEETEEGRTLLPDEFRALWTSIRSLGLQDGKVKEEDHASH